MHSFTGMGSAIGKDVPAYVMVTGSPAAAKSVNTEGLRRRGFSKDEVAAITKAFKIIYRRGLTLDEALAQLQVLAESCPRLMPMIESLRSSSRGIVR
jgi:UDP-N-acetylglucosamine acyltransferase